MFSQTAALYDIIYHWKDYRAEADKLHQAIETHQHTPARTLLDVGCGTGKHLVYLQQWYVCEGLDLDAELLQSARGRLPDVPLHHDDMLTFDLGRTFDVVTCLFGAVGYMGSEARFRAAVANMARHVRPGGLLIIEPFLFREDFTPGKISLQTAEVPGLSLARMSVSRLEGEAATFTFNYLVGTASGVQHLEEAHVLGVFPRAVYADAAQAADMQVVFDETGLMGRGLFVAIRP